MRTGFVLTGLLAALVLTLPAGAALFAAKWPNPRPATFGYHEVWHVMVVSASICHYAAIMHLLVRR